MGYYWPYIAFILFLQCLQRAERNGFLSSMETVSNQQYLGFRKEIHTAIILLGIVIASFVVVPLQPRALVQPSLLLVPLLRWWMCTWAHTTMTWTLSISIALAPPLVACCQAGLAHCPVILAWATKISTATYLTCQWVLHACLAGKCELHVCMPMCAHVLFVCACGS